MKSLLTFLSLILFSITAHSQILNGGFEDWTNGKPNDWRVDSTNEPVKADTNSHSGNSCFGGGFWDSDIPGQFHYTDGINLTNSTIAHPGGSAIIKGTNSIVFWYQWGATNTKNAGLRVKTSMSPTWISLDYGGWRKFSIPITDSPDSIILQFNFYGRAPSHSSIRGTFLLDDISFEMPSAVNSSVPSSNTISVSPNPISGYAKLYYQSDGVEPIHVTLYDIMGREVLRLPQAESVSGDGMIPFDCKQLPNGLYYLRFEKGSVIVSRKIVVAH